MDVALWDWFETLPDFMRKSDRRTCDYAPSGAWHADGLSIDAKGHSGNGTRQTIRLTTGMTTVPHNRKDHQKTVTSHHVSYARHHTKVPG